jgi:hypothetical protein
MVLAMLGTVACSGKTGPKESNTAPGADRTARTAALETAADVVQTTAPIDKIGMYLDGFHTAKNDPAMQMEAHHFCNQVNEDFTQCVLFDGNTADSRLMGVEYSFPRPRTRACRPMRKHSGTLTTTRFCPGSCGCQVCLISPRRKR